MRLRTRQHTTFRTRQHTTFTPTPSRGGFSARVLLALVSVLGLVATACGGGYEGPTEVVNAEGVEKTGWGAPVVPAEAADRSADADDEPFRTLGAPDTEDDDAQPPADGDGDGDGDGAVDETVAASVLAYVIENTEGVSYSFEQGFGMTVDLGGESIVIGVDDPYVFGEVDGGDSHVRADLGVLLTATFESLGIDPNDPELGGFGAALASASFDVWTEGDVMTLDVADFVSAMEQIEPGSMTGLGALSDGPVSVDLSALDDIDAWSITQALGDGSQVVDPSALVDALRAVESVTEVGRDSINGRDVTVYAGSLSMADYFAAMGQDLDGQLAVLDDVGGGVEAGLVDVVAEGMAAIDVHVTVMVDGSNMLRRMETVMNMGEMFGSLAYEADIEMSVSVWQEFDEYGKSFDLEPPAAVDVTDQFSSLFGDLLVA